MPHLFATFLVIALLGASDHASADRRSTLVETRDSASEAMIVGEMRAFYRDLDRQNWPALLDHFLPAKVTARWVPPITNRMWAELATPAISVADDSQRCELRMSVAIVGDWARVRVRRCALSVDEAWLLHVSGHWKIVHLVLADAPAA
jgi:hypothetical protein